jgi:hypothetical protein
MIERCCTVAGCERDTSCRYRDTDGTCVFEYVVTNYLPKHQWLGDGPVPARWRRSDGTFVYRSYADYCDD